MPYQTILEQLSKTGFRRTKIRETLLRLFVKSTAPLSVPELMNSGIELRGVNKTTLYREVNFLTKQQILVTVILGDEKTRYELASRAHHHHLVCEDCGQVADVTLVHDLASEEQRIRKLHHFKIRRHSLEFFGRCSSCQ